MNEAQPEIVILHYSIIVHSRNAIDDTVCNGSEPLWGATVTRKKSLKIAVWRAKSYAW
jgi:hypothetical protein